MSEPFRKPKRTWLSKFVAAFRGVGLGVRGQNSFIVHASATVAVVAAARWFGVSFAEWCLLTVCITIVLASELFNSALESLAKAIDDKHNAHLANALDIASGAVLCSAMGAAIAGVFVFWPYVQRMLEAP